MSSPTESFTSSRQIFCTASIAATFGNQIFVVTGNGTDEGWVRIPAPHAPSLICLDKTNGKAIWTGFYRELEHSPENIDAWVGEMLKLADGQPIAIMAEQTRGALVYALIFRENVLLYPINPKQLARYRESFPGGGKNDPTDAKYLARMLRERITTLTAWQPDDEDTRLLAQLSEQRRKIVDGQTKLRQQLTAHLKSYLPVVLELFGGDHQLNLFAPLPHTSR